MIESLNDEDILNKCKDWIDKSLSDLKSLTKFAFSYIYQNIKVNLEWNYMRAMWLTRGSTLEVE